MLETYGRSHPRWEIDDDGRYVIGSLGSNAPDRRLMPEAPIFIPDELVAPRHALVISHGGRYYVEPHAELHLPLARDARVMGE